MAIATSLPELVTTIAAIRMGALDMAIGNVLGSNTFNMAILWPVDIFYRQGSLLNDASNVHAVSGSCVVVITTILAITMLMKPKEKKPAFNLPAALITCSVLFSIWAVYYFKDLKL